MTRDELLTRIGDNEKFLEQYFGAKFEGQSALRAVVELHKPDEFNFCNCGWEYKYPCPTIQAIEKKLK